jgi:rhamnulokinase
VNSPLNVLACDVGAGSGRFLHCQYSGDELKLNEITRFSNHSVKVGKSLYWDILSIYKNIQLGLAQASIQGIKPASLGIDTWGNDFALLDKNGLLLENPYTYRDQRTIDIIPYVRTQISDENLYARNGIQQVRMNTLYQLTSLAKNRPHIFDHAKHFLFIPDLLTYFLTGETHCEYTLSTISQLYNYQEADWDNHLMDLLNIPQHLFPPIIHPGNTSGTIIPTICHDLNIDSIPLITVGAHDTASAVAAVPETEDQPLFISSGTWSIVGTEIDPPLINETTFKHNFSNEGGVGNKIRLNKNVMGLWILQEIQRKFSLKGKAYTYEEMARLAEDAPPFGSLIDPDHHCFYEPTNMPRVIQNYCFKTGQTVPETDGEIIRCALESLALKYRYVIEALEHATNRTYPNIHIIGGGSKNIFLSQLTANYCQRPVHTGPTEATALGNALIQLIALGELSNIQDARALVKQCFPSEHYTPQSNTEHYDEHYQYFLSTTKLPPVN